jgi:hypothetical protein
MGLMGSIGSMEKITPPKLPLRIIVTAQVVPIFGGLRNQPRHFVPPIPNKRGLHHCQLSPVEPVTFADKSI